MDKLLNKKLYYVLQRIIKYIIGYILLVPATILFFILMFLSPLWYRFTGIKKIHIIYHTYILNIISRHKL